MVHPQEPVNDFLVEARRLLVVSRNHHLDSPVARCAQEHSLVTKSPWPIEPPRVNVMLRELLEGRAFRAFPKKHIHLL